MFCVRIFIPSNPFSMQPILMKSIRISFGRRMIAEEPAPIKFGVSYEYNGTSSLFSRRVLFFRSFSCVFLQFDQEGNKTYIFMNFLIITFVYHFMTQWFDSLALSLFTENRSMIIKYDWIIIWTMQVVKIWSSWQWMRIEVWNPIKVLCGSIKCNRKNSKYLIWI